MIDMFVDAVSTSGLLDPQSVIAGAGAWGLWVVIPAIALSAALGDQLGYVIGRTSGCRPPRECSRVTVDDFQPVRLDRSHRALILRIKMSGR